MDFQEFKGRYQKKEVLENKNSVQNSPMFSICVQTYQHVNYIRECLDGILNQKTNFPFEILLGEDGSTDGTREICTEYAERFPKHIRLFLHHRENNIRISGKPTGRFNFLYNLYSSKGKYIAICEGDDYWTDPLKLQKQMNFLEKHREFVITFHDAKIVNEQGELLQDSKLLTTFKQDLTGEELIKGPFLLTLSLSFRNILREFPEEIFKIVNGDKFLISLLGQHGKGKYLPQITKAVYRKHSTSMWSSKKRNEQVFDLVHTFYTLGKYYKSKKDYENAFFFQKKSKEWNLQLLESLCTKRNFIEFSKACKYFVQKQRAFSNVKDSCMFLSYLARFGFNFFYRY